jgi:hypothetical protein
MMFTERVLGGGGEDHAERVACFCMSTAQAALMKLRCSSAWRQCS